MWDEHDKKPIAQFLALTFLFAWLSESMLIAGERFGIITGAVGSVAAFIIIVFGAGLAPTYAIIILLKKHGQIRGFKDVCTRIFKTENVLKTIIITAVFFGSQLIFNIICNSYTGNWYIALFSIPIMIIGGGMEELGWRGFLQPALEEKMPFVAATFSVGIIWAVWHLPLWLIQNANQSSMNILAFFAYCVTLGFVLAALYKLTKSVFACVLLHAWGNALGASFKLDFLTNTPDMKLLVVYTLEIFIAILFCLILKRKSAITSRA